MMRNLAAALLLLTLSASFAAAGASQWHRVEGGAVRVVTASEPDAAGRLAAALEIRLEPGWKTYWRDPGDAGVPPQLSVRLRGEPVASTLHFPAPERFDDGYSIWAGYAGDVAFPVDIDLAGRPAGDLEFDVFFGICETICIPVQAKLTAGSQAGAGTAEVRAAYDRLPAPANAAFGARMEAAGDDHFTVEATVPDGASAGELYIASLGRTVFGTPETIEAAPGRLRFRVPILRNRLDEAAQYPYTLVTAGGAVSGELAAPASR